jgi:Flp pilus assembly protein TadB
MANKRNDNRHLQNIPKIYLILAVFATVFAVLTLLKVIPIWLAIVSVILVALLFFMQLGAMATKTKEENKD